MIPASNNKFWFYKFTILILSITLPLYGQCPPDRPIACSGGCYPATTICCTGPSGEVPCAQNDVCCFGHCRPMGHECCGNQGIACDPSTTKCCNGEQCIPTSFTCCPDGRPGIRYACPPNLPVCCNGGCYPVGTICCNETMGPPCPLGTPCCCDDAFPTVTDIFNNYMLSPPGVGFCDRAINECAIRLGIALQVSGVDISSSSRFRTTHTHPGITELHQPSALSLADWLESNLGPPQKLSNATREYEVIDFAGKSGILYFVHEGRGGTGPGHIDVLLDGMIRDHFYPNTKIWFWEYNNCWNP